MRRLETNAVEIWVCINRLLHYFCQKLKKMNSYRKDWIKLLKDQKTADWHVSTHGQAIVLKIGTDKDFDAIKATFPQLITDLSKEISTPKEWTKFILYNGKSSFQFIIEKE